MFKKILVTLCVATLVAGSATAASATIVSNDFRFFSDSFQFAKRSTVCDEAAAPDRQAELQAYRDTLRQERRAQSDDLIIRVADINRPGIAHQLGPVDRLTYMQNRNAAMRDAARSRTELRRVRKEIRFVSRALKNPTSTCN